jgi:dinuclear metal center YbgI/SA1388 family protein
MFVSEFISAVDRLAPFELAEPGDNGGRLGGGPAARVARALVTLDVNLTALDEARRSGCQLLLAHHPLFFDPLAAVTDASFQGKAVLQAVRDGIAVAVAHTNLDKARGGLADIVCEALDLEGVRPLAPARVELAKLVGFVPEVDLDTVRSAVFAAGGGVIGEYVHCSFSTEGEGTFLATEGTSPTAGEVGKDQTTGELRLEVVFPRSLRRQVIDAFVSAHSYEEPAFDVYPVENEVASLGLGRIGYLPAPAALGELAALVAGVFGLRGVRFTGDSDRQVTRVACLPGSGASLIEQAAAVGEVFITGDIKYHDADMADRLGLSLIEVPHELCEGFALERWAERFADVMTRQGVEVRFFEQRRRLWRLAGPLGESAEVEGRAGEAADAAAPPASAARPNGGGRRPSNSSDDHYELFVDGGARGNPGPAGIGVRLLDTSGEVAEELGDYIGEATNNVAEYQALVTGLEMAVDHGVRRLTVFSDSELVVRQLSGQYKVRDEVLSRFHDTVRRLLHQFQEVEVKSIPREENAAADRLVNQAIDRFLS